MKEEKSARTFVLRCFVARHFPSLNSPNSSFQKRKLPFACSTFSRVRDAMVKLYTFHMFNKKVCLSLFSSRFEFLSKQTSFLTLSDADISSLFPQQHFPGRNRLLPRVVATVPSKRKRPRRDENVVRTLLYDESVRDENGPDKVRFVM